MNNPKWKAPKPSSLLFFLQINLNHRLAALDNSLHLSSSLTKNILLITELFTKNSSIPAPGWNSVFNGKSSILIRKGVLFFSFNPLIPNLTHIKIQRINILSIYCPPSSDLPPLLDALASYLLNFPRVILSGDFNCSSSLLPLHPLNFRGHSFDSFLLTSNFILLNDNSPIL